MTIQAIVANLARRVGYSIGFLLGGLVCGGAAWVLLAIFLIPWKILGWQVDWLAEGAPRYCFGVGSLAGMVLGFVGPWEAVLQGKKRQSGDIFSDTIADIRRV